MTLDSLNTGSTMTTTEPNMSMAELNGTVIVLPSPPNLKTESASWHSQLPASTATIQHLSVKSAPAVFSTLSSFGSGTDRVNGCVILEDLEQFVLDNTSTAMDYDDNDASTPFIQDPMPRSRISSIPDTTMLLSMDDDNNNDGGDDTEHEDFSFDTDDFVLIRHNNEVVSPPLSPFVLFPPNMIPF